MLKIPSVTPASFRQYLHSHRDRVYRYVIKEIGQAVDQNLAAIQLFQIGKSEQILELKQQNYKAILNAAMEFFVTKEMYEDCAVCRDIINKMDNDPAKGGEG